MKRTVICLVSFFIFHFSFAQQGTWFWGVQGIGDAAVESVASDAQGNCCLAGLFTNDTIHFGLNTLSNSQWGLDAFLVKYAPNGSLLWAKQTIEKNINHNDVNDEPVSVCTDLWGNIYLSGDYIDTIFIGAFSLITKEPATNTFLVKYAPNGTVLWVKDPVCISDSAVITQDGVSSDCKGNVYVTGGINSGAIQIGSSILSAPLYASYAFLAKYDSAGNVKWAKQSTGHGLGGSSGNSVANDPKGNTFITGGFADTVSFGPYQLIGGSNADFYLVKYDSNGNVLWAKHDSERRGGSSVGVSLVTDQTGNIYAAVQFDGTILFGQDTMVSHPGHSSFCIVKYGLSGNILWAKQASVLDGNNWNIWSLSIDNSKHLYFSGNGGYNTCKIAFGGDTVSMMDTAAFDGASIIFKLDSNGNAICSSITPVGSLSGISNAIASDTSGNHVYFGASAGTIAIFGKDTINPFFPPDPHTGGDVFPFAARWEECNPTVIYAGGQNVKPVGQVVLYPNPNNGSFTLALQNVNTPAQVEVYNILGESIYKTKLNPTNTVLSLSGQPNGVYFYRVITQDGGLVGSGKVILQK